MSGLAAALAGAKLRRVQRVSVAGPWGRAGEDEAGGPFPTRGRITTLPNPGSPVTRRTGAALREAELPPPLGGNRGLVM